MKRITSILLSVAFAATFVSCDPMIWDLTPINIYVTVSNADGQNMLDSITPNNFVGKEITAEWDGEIYVADTIPAWQRQVMTREYMPEMNGLMYVVKDGKQALCFGEIDGADTWEEEPLTLRWPDGSTDVITVEAWAHQGYRKLTTFREFKLNGEVVGLETQKPVINIVK